MTVAAATGMETDGLTKPMMVLEQPRARDLLSRFHGAGSAWISKLGEIVVLQGLRLSNG